MVNKFQSDDIRLKYAALEGSSQQRSSGFFAMVSMVGLWITFRPCEDIGDIRSARVQNICKALAYCCALVLQYASNECIALLRMPHAVKTCRRFWVASGACV